MEIPKVGRAPGTSNIWKNKVHANDTIWPAYDYDYIFTTYMFYIFYKFKASSSPSAWVKTKYNLALDVLKYDKKHLRLNLWHKVTPQLRVCNYKHT